MADDKRVKHTKKRIKDAMIDCLLKNSLDKITVSAVCNTAEINRNTFYAYYSDTYELYNKIERETVEMLNKNLSQLWANKMTYKKFIDSIVTFVHSNDKVCLALIKTNSKSFQEAHLTFFQEFDNGNFFGKETEKRYVFGFYISGVFNVLGEWLTTNKQQSIEYMSDLIYRLTYSNYSDNQ